MKKLFFLAVIATSLAACGGWNDEKRAKVKSECENISGAQYSKEDLTKICDCVSSNMNAKFPKADFEVRDINNQTSACIKEGNYLDVFEKELQDSFN
jgi:hypothetical protein